MIQLVVSDLDGTLLSDPQTIHPDNVAAIRRMMQKGVHFAVASGRFVYSCSCLLHRHGLMDAHIIAVNGGQIADKPFGRMLAIHHISPETAEKAVNCFVKYGLAFCLYTESSIIYSDESIQSAHGPTIEAPENATCQTFKPRVTWGMPAVLASLHDNPLKLFCVYGRGQKEAFLEARRVCEGFEGAEITSSWHDNFEVMPKGVNKGMAVRQLASELGIKRENIMAFGDGENDLPMLTWAGVGIAMENARDMVKQAVGRVTGLSGEGGVAQAIERYILR